MKIEILDRDFTLQTTLSPNDKSHYVDGQFWFSIFTSKGKRVRFKVPIVGFHSVQVFPQHSMKITVESYLTKAIIPVLSEKQFYCAQKYGVKVWGLYFFNCS